MAQQNCDLNTCFLCRHCIPDWKALIDTKKETLSYKKGKTIFSEGDPVRGIYFMYEGWAKVSKNWGPQKELLLRFAKPGDVVGHRGFGGDLHYPVAATALEDCKVCFISNEFLETILQTNPSFTRELMKVYAEELQKVEKRMRDLIHRDVKGRIALALQEMAETFGTDSEGYPTVTVARQDIASFAGTTYETVFKFFSELQANKVISTSGKRIRINNSKRLQKFIIDQF